MDRHFLEFWGNYLLSVAKGQKQLEDFANWIRQGLKGADELSTMFQKTYGLGDYDNSDPESTSDWEKAAENFRESFGDYFRMMGWISKEEYQAIEEENRSLKIKIDEQDQKIKRLQNLLRQPTIDQNQTLNVLQDLINKQSDEFQKLLTNLSTPDKKNSET